MSHVTAVLEGVDDPQVIQAGTTLARLLGVETAFLRVPAEGGSARVERAVKELGEPDVAAVVLSARSHRTICWEVLPSVSKPVLVIPERCERRVNEISTVMLPLDGTSSATRSIASFAKLALDRGADVSAIHVFDPATVPAFWDQSAHSHQAWLREFRARNLPDPVRLDLRHGRAAEEVLDEAERSDVDLLVLGWSQESGADRARVVRMALEQGSIPILLFSTREQPDS